MSVFLKDDKVQLIGGKVATGANCCCQTCPTPTLVCDSISASISKGTCGFDTFIPSDPPRKYLTRTDQFDCSATVCNGSYQLPCPCDGTGYREPCIKTRTYEQSFDPSDNCSYLSSDESDSFGDCGFGGNGGCDLGFTTVDTTETSITVTRDHTTWGNNADPPACGDFGGYVGVLGTTTEVATLSNEFTSEVLCEEVVEKLPEYFGQLGCEESEEIGFREEGQGCVCFASRNLSEDESSCTINRFKYAFQFEQTPTSACYLKILWNETEKPTLTEDVTYGEVDYHIGDEDPDPSHWTCNPMEWTWEGGDCAEEGTIESDTFECLEPAVNGTVYITDIRWSIRTDYSPVAAVPCGGVGEPDQAAEQNCIPAPPEE